MVISNWVSENYNYIKKKGLILDLACGAGRHGRFLLEKGFDVVFLDRDTSQLDWVPEAFRSRVIKHDLEAGTSWGFSPCSFDAVVHLPCPSATMERRTEHSRSVRDATANRLRVWIHPVCEQNV